MKGSFLSNYLFLIIAIGILSAGFHGIGLIKGAPAWIFYSDTLGFYEKTTTPGFFYLDKNIEYPVIIGLFLQLMGYFSASRAGYFIFSSLFLVLAAVLATYFLHKLASEENEKRILKYWIFAPSMVVFLTYNWDIFAILFIVVALYLVKENSNEVNISHIRTNMTYKENNENDKKRNLMAAGFLALGASAKLYPIIYLAPLFLKAKDWSERIKIILVFGLTLLAVNLPFMILNFSGWSYFVRLNSERNSNPDSIWTIARFFFRDLGVPGINSISLILFLAAAGLLLWKFRRESFLKLCFGLTILFLLFNKVFTPQYLMWLLPFFVLLPELKAKEFYFLEFSNLAVFFSILPWFFLGHDMFYFYLSAPFVILRHLMLIFMLWHILTTRFNALKQPYKNSLVS